jgi:1-acyl-sn-glycerol-3-phosphate acyltransferase
MLLLLPLGVVLTVLSLLGLRRPIAWVVYRLAQGWAKVLIRCTGCTFTVSGREHIPRKQGICFVSNHGSIFDIILLLAVTGRPIGFIAKKELSRIPLLNVWILLLGGGMFLDRKNVRKAVATIKNGVKRIQHGGAMIIFPEGHRSRGQGLLPFHQGSFKLATQSAAPVVPVAIAGTWDVWEKTGLVRRRPVNLTFLAPVVAADIPSENRRQALAEKVRSVIAAELAKWGVPDAAAGSLG